jgi:hypothetical protein
MSGLNFKVLSAADLMDGFFLFIFYLPKVQLVLQPVSGTMTILLVNDVLEKILEEADSF